MSSAPVLVVGATGNVGHHVVKHLLSTGRQVRVLARDPRKAADLLGPDVEIARTPHLGRQEVNFIDAASAAGVRRLVKQSGAGVGVLKGAISVAHSASERRLHASGIPAVLVKPVTLMSNLLGNAEAIKSGSPTTRSPPC